MKIEGNFKLVNRNAHKEGLFKPTSKLVGHGNEMFEEPEPGSPPKFEVEQDVSLDVSEEDPEDNNTDKSLSQAQSKGTQPGLSKNISQGRDSNPSMNSSLHGERDQSPQNQPTQIPGIEFPLQMSKMAARALALVKSKNKVTQLLMYMKNQDGQGKGLFWDSKVGLNDEQKKNLYLNIVHDVGLPAILTKIASFEKGKAPSAPNEVLEKLKEAEETTLFLFSQDSRIFGGYASEKWRENGKYGDLKCFLFNLTSNTRLSPNLSNPKLVYQYSDLSSGLGWGSTDLILNSDGKWYSEINCCYSNGDPCNLLPRSLIYCDGPTPTGSSSDGKIFEPDVFEIWKVVFSAK